MSDDPYRWLEEISGDAPMAWVRERNAETLATLATGERFEALRAEIREVLDSDARIPLPTWHGEHVYNLWRDVEHPRGLWRRTTLEEFRRADPEWQVLLDLDALGSAEGENWVWQSVAVLEPAGDRALVSLSRGGADASVVREFDLVRREFVTDGFVLAEAKSDVTWIDRDHIYVGTDFGPGSLTTSGYPRVLKRWSRGTPLAQAETVFEGEADDVSVRAVHDPTPGFERSIFARHPEFFTSEYFFGSPLRRLEVPDDALLDLHREWLTVRLRSAWPAYPAGALLAIRLADFLAGDRAFDVLFTPDEHTSLSYHEWTRGHVLLALLTDVVGRLELRTPGPDGWSAVALTGGAADAIATIDIVDTNRDRSDEYFTLAEGFLEPPTLRYGSAADEPVVVRRAPAFFDTAGLSARQFFAVSSDGTRIPYFVVGRFTGAGPTLLTGYGGFEVSRTPAYLGSIGRGWLARGGTYVLANIRGGGEYGPQWHDAALREKRLRAYEDFAAVAQDLVARGITTRERLGIEGGSNGGLLMGVMLTRYPELFGAIVCNVPLLDMRRYHLLLAGASWMAEYGDPDNPDDWAFISEYSPYQNVAPGRPYPPVLMVTSTRDDRVHPGHARKMVARLRELGCDVTSFENIEGGHGAAADNAQLAFKTALSLEFFWRRLTHP
jgi:prolyl oligopeptidase